MSALRRDDCNQELTALAKAALPPGPPIAPKAKAEFDKGRKMRGCLVPHPDGGCLSDEGFTVKRAF
jgi:hypothetical protein